MSNNEPIVLGTVKKGKTGKPLLVLILFLFIGAILFSLPVINSYFEGYNIIELIKNGEFILFIQNHDQYINNKNQYVENTTTTIAQKKDNEPKLINKKTVLEYNNFNINEINLTETSMTYKINTTTNINFDKSNYYLVLSKNNKKIYIKLTGEINGSKEYKFNFVNNLTTTIEIEGVIKEIKESEYTNIKLSTDVLGFSMLTCVKENQNYKYTFNQNKLIIISDTLNYVKTNLEDYHKQYQEYIDISNNINALGGISQFTETTDGFVLQNNIDLNIYNYIQNKNSNYYSLNTQPKIVNFEMEAKGYDCK